MELLSFFFVILPSFLLCYNGCVENIWFYFQGNTKFAIFLMNYFTCFSAFFYWKSFSQFNGNWLCWENVYVLKYLLLKVFFCFIDIEKIKFISCHNPAMHSKIEKFSAQCKVYFLGVEVEFLFLWEKREKWRKCHWLSSSFLLLKVEINCLRNLCLPNKRKNFPWKLSFHKNSFKAQHKSIKLRFFSFLFTGIERGQIGHI